VSILAFWCTSPSHPSGLRWRQALEALRELTLTQTQLTHEGALSQPLWDNRHYPPPGISPILRVRDRWESLQVTVVHNLYDADRKGRVPFTREDNALYIDTESDHHYVQNKTMSTNDSSSRGRRYLTIAITTDSTTGSVRLR
jgi:hypothetical protein